MDLNRWWEESDLDEADLACVAMTAIAKWLSEEVIDFEPDEG